MRRFWRHSVFNNIVASAAQKGFFRVTMLSQFAKIPACRRRTDDYLSSPRWLRSWVFHNPILCFQANRWLRFSESSQVSAISHQLCQDPPRLEDYDMKVNSFFSASSEGSAINLTWARGRDARSGRNSGRRVSRDKKRKAGETPALPGQITRCATPLPPSVRYSPGPGG